MCNLVLFMQQLFLPCGTETRACDALACQCLPLFLRSTLDLDALNTEVYSTVSQLPGTSLPAAVAAARTYRCCSAEADLYPAFSCVKNYEDASF